MRLIDADALADALFEKRKNYPQWVADVIGEMPTIDTDAMLKEQEEQIKNRDDSLEKAREEIKWLRELLKEQENKLTNEEALRFIEKLKSDNNELREKYSAMLKEQEAKTGEWIYKHDNLWYCSKCGEIIYSETDEDLEVHHAYCSRCGAKMKQEGR